ncbi:MULTISPECIES: DNA cytosine methyltransferase [unclassified Fibrobacter]|uniref:DNA cytosine methyltransferase n=1 Tax=unclassified Fibrobacter TaxID=2634177 RepID=UPI0025BF63CE|nr:MULTISPECIES: DNA cytosine methyltransferase [unclassified Fibrobacter]
MPINVVDLFSGAGGLTCGFSYKIENNSFKKTRDFNFIFANEYNEQAAKAFATNFNDIHLIKGDIAKITQNTLSLENISSNIPVDLIIGGPPCQSYSTVGKRQYDQRAKMYQEYTKMLRFLQPAMFIFENVTGLLSMRNDKGNPVIDDISALFDHITDSLGYRLYRKVLNAKDFGVPQSRERVFIVGLRKDIDYEWKFPSPTHGQGLKDYVTVAEAISDLPLVRCGQKKEKYTKATKTDYQLLMRGNSVEIYDHECGIYGDRMNTIIKAVKEGKGRPYINELVASGVLPQECHLTSGYNNTYGRLWWHKPSTTITNSLGTPSALRCIHPLQNRALTTREGARLQSMPDWMRFYGNRHERNSQVGNAVPPLLAMAIANEVKKIPFNSFRK